jgi:hypothetical protein
LNIKSLIPALAVQQARNVGSNKDISIIIAHRGPEMGLWATIHSCDMELRDSGFTYEFIVVVNGEERLSDDMKRLEDNLDKVHKLADFVHVVQPMSPPSARQLGTASAKGKYLFFFDNHCLVGRNYFHRAIASMEKHGIEMLHSTTRFWEGDGDYFEYRLTLKRDFWVEGPYKTPQSTDEPYRCAMAGHGGFVVTRTLWDELNGYWEGFTGYGGEEPYWDLKCWLLGKSVWIDPKLIHYHWAGKRSYSRHLTNDYFTNMLMCANIIGGEQWLFNVYKSFAKYTRLATREEKPEPLFTLLQRAAELSHSRAQWVRSKQVISLDELLPWFDANNIRQ